MICVYIGHIQLQSLLWSDCLTLLYH